MTMEEKVARTKKRFRHKDGYIPFDDDLLSSIVIYAMRYTLGRATYAPHDVMAFAKPLLPYFDDVTLFVMARDIQDAKKCGSLGHETIDAPAWLKFFDEIEEERRRRKENAARL